MTLLFGRATLYVSSSPSKGVDGHGRKLGAVLNIEECQPSTIGAGIPDSAKLANPKRLRMFFTSEESVDVMINHLQSIKEMIKEAQSGKRL